MINKYPWSDQSKNIWKWILLANIFFEIPHLEILPEVFIQIIQINKAYEEK